MTAFYMVINNTYCLHIGIYNCTAYKFETMLFQILADFIRKGCSCRYVTFSIKMIFNRLIIDIRPYERIKASVFLLYISELLCVNDCRLNFQSVTNNFFILHQILNFCFIIERYFSTIKSVKGFSKRFSLMDFLPFGYAAQAVKKV